MGHRLTVDLVGKRPVHSGRAFCSGCGVPPGWSDEFLRALQPATAATAIRTAF